MNGQRLRPETRTALLLAITEIEVALAGATDPELHALLERTQGDIAAGWPEAAHDALGRARRLLQSRTEGNPR